MYVNMQIYNHSQNECLYMYFCCTISATQPPNANSYKIGYMLLNKFCIIVIQKISVVAVTALLLQTMAFSATLL